VASADLATCGSSCTPCPSPPNATATCNGSTCGYTCNAGFGDCDGDTSNGCESTAIGAGNSVLFCDGFESGLLNWTTNAYWGQTAFPYSGSYSMEGTAGSAFPGSCNKSGYSDMAFDVDLSHFAVAELTYESWSAPGADDTMSVYASTNGGSSWSQLPSPSTGSSWQLQSVGLGAYVGSPQLRIRYQFLNLCGDCCGLDWYVDNVRIEAK
jgi:hypothetical protein